MSAQKELQFSVDEPSEAQEFASGEVSVRGWAMATANSLSLTAKLGDNPWVQIPHGKTRTDVAKAHPNVPEALRSGFGRRLDVRELPVGECDFVIRIQSAEGTDTEIRRKIRILDSAKLARESVLSLPNDFLRLKLDEPSEHSLVLSGSVLKVTGWAVAKTGVKQLQVWLDDDGPHSIHYGLMREDVGSLYDDFPGASHAGFLWAWQIHHLAPGTHTLRLVATSKAGNSTELTSTFEVDPRTEYEIWADLNHLKADQLLNLFDKTTAISYTPTISIITPVYRTPKAFLNACVGSVKKQVYPNWQLILVDDASQDRKLTSSLRKWAEEDPRIRTIELTSNTGIAGATNAGLEICTGEYVAMLDHDDELSPDALLRIVETLNQDPTLDVLYSDEDKIDEHGTHSGAFFKPDWSPELLLSMNYVCHFLVCRRSLLQDIAGFRLGFDGSQDYDVILRLSERTSKIRRIPKVLYHWRTHEQSTASSMDKKPMASEAGRRAIEQHFERVGVKAQVKEIGPGRYRPTYEITGDPAVAIIIPTGGSPTLEAALDSILEETTYRNYHIVVVDNSSGDRVSQTVTRFQNLSSRISLVDCRGLPFNFSLLCNRAAESTTANYLLFLNDDTSVITPDWIESMLEHAQQPEIGAVGALLLFPNGTIQHAGVATGLFEIAGHPFRGLPEKPYYFDFTHVIRNCAAVTGACLMVRRDVFHSVGGFDEPNLPTCFQDVDLCLKMLDQGYRVVYTPFAKLFHYESFSKKSVAELPELKYMKQRWPSYLKEDPYYSPNLTRYSDDYSLRYDQFFLNIDSPRPSTPAAERLSCFGNVDFYTSPKAGSASRTNSVPPTVIWSAKGAEKVQIRVGSPMGPLFAEGGPSGSATTGPWIEPGTAFYLLDATENSIGSPDRVLAALQV